MYYIYIISIVYIIYTLFVMLIEEGFCSLIIVALLRALWARKANTYLD